MLYDATGTPLEGEPEPVRYFPLGPFGTADIMGHEPGRAYGARPIGSPFGGAHEFMEEDEDYIDCGRNKIVSGNATWSSWIRWNGSSGEYNVILSKRDSYNGGETRWFIEIDKDGLVNWGSHTDYVSFDWMPPEYRWVYLTIVRDEINGDTKLYVDGSHYETINGGGYGEDDNALIQIGATDGGGENYLNGTISEVIIWDWALNPRHVKWLYHHPTGLRQPSSAVSILSDYAPNNSVSPKRFFSTTSFVRS